MISRLIRRPTGAPYHGNSVILNTLGDLTNRENRFAYQRFSSDFQNLAGALVPGGDGLSDDLNGDNVPDYYPTLYPTVLARRSATPAAHLRTDPGQSPGAGGDGVSRSSSRVRIPSPRP